MMRIMISMSYYGGRSALVPTNIKKTADEDLSHDKTPETSWHADTIKIISHGESEACCMSYSYI